ncbi:MAG: protease complex subunit PrcB family protein [Eubacteriales bacterium]
MKRIRIFIVTILLLLFVVVGCKTQKINDGEKISNIEFSILDEDDAPQEVKDYIEEQKKEPFRFTYTNCEKYYIVIGYGEKPTGGYSVQVKELYETNKSIIVETELLGPSKDDVVSMALTYPYIIIQTEYIDKPVSYE